ncbi:hypothetical protein ILUMI_17417, partial [Ignelater luminosus]
MPNEKEQSDELSKFINKRGTIRDQLTQFESCIDLWDKFDDLQSQIEIISQEQEQVEYRSIFENQYFTVVSQGKILLEESKSTPVPAPQILGTNSVIGERSKPPTSEPRLPPIDLPQFSGAYEQWFSFVDNFKALVNCNGNVAEVHKFYYLQRCLKGKARQVIEALDVTAANYSTAWDLLRERFENKRLIVDKHIQGILSLPTIKQESASLLRAFLDTIQKNMRSLQALEINTSSWDTLLTYICAQKFDLDTKHEWESSTPDKNIFPTLKEFTDFLLRRCQLLEKIDPGWKVNKTKNDKVSIKSYLTTSARVTCNYCN